MEESTQAASQREEMLRLVEVASVFFCNGRRRKLTYVHFYFHCSMYHACKEALRIIGDVNMSTTAINTAPAPVNTDWIRSDNTGGRLAFRIVIGMTTDAVLLTPVPSPLSVAVTVTL